MDTKVCLQCRTRKHLSEFHRCNRVKDGHTSRCKQCRCKHVVKRFAPIVTLAADRLEAYKFESRHPVRTRKRRK